MLTTYLHIRAAKNEWKLSTREYVFIGLVVYMGFATHYYYAVYIAGMFAVCTVQQLRHSHKEAFSKYFRTMVVAGIISLCTWPFSVYHILFGYRGSEAFSRFSIIGLFGKLSKLANTYNKALFFGNSVFAAVIAVISLLIIIWSINKVSSMKDDPFVGCLNEYGLILFVPAIVYSVLVGMVAPSASIRYFVCIIPYICLMLATIMYLMMNALVEAVHMSINVGVACVMMAVVYSALSVAITTPDYLYLDQRDMTIGVNNRSDYNAVMIGYGQSEGFAVAVNLSEYSEVLVISHDKLSRLKETHPKSNQNTIIYLKDEFEYDDYIPYVTEYLGYNNERVTEISSDIMNYRAYLVEL